MAKPGQCVLCDETGGELIVQGDAWRIVLAGEQESLAFPGFTRVIWQTHHREMTDLEPAARRAVMDLVFDVEALMREHLGPDKINLASLGNQVDHLHWHIIPRWRSDSHFPSPVWASAQPGRSPMSVPAGHLQNYRRALADKLTPSVGQAGR